MCHTILVPLDGSKLAERALPYARALARRTGAKLLLLRAAFVPELPGVDRGPTQLRAIDEAELYLAGMSARLAHEAAVETAVFYGHPGEGIVDEIGIRSADLVVMATHGRSGLGRWVYGSVAEAVLRDSPVPILLIRGWGAEPVPTQPFAEQPQILVPLDGSCFAEQALPVAQEMAWLLGGKVVLFEAVAQPTDTQVADRGRLIGYSQEVLAARKQAALTGEGYGYVRAGYLEPETNGTTVAYVDQILHGRSNVAADYLRVVARWESRGQPEAAPEIRVRVGPPVEAIIEASHDLAADLIVMATHGRTGLKRLVMGSVAEGVVRRGTVPILLVRPPSLR